MEWTGTGTLDKELINEIKSDYAGSHVLLYDTASDISIKFQPGSGLVLYYKGSYIQITPDNNITIHYGEGATGTQIQLSNGRVDIQAQTQINITSGKAINLEADTITLNGNTAVQIKGDKAGECAINGVQLISALLQLAQGIAAKRSDRETSNGCVLVKAVDGFAAIVALKCETDFVANGTGILQALPGCLLLREL